MYDVSRELFNGIRSVYVNSLVCVRAKGGESEGFLKLVVMYDKDASCTLGLCTRMR